MAHGRFRDRWEQVPEPLKPASIGGADAVSAAESLCADRHVWSLPMPRLSTLMTNSLLLAASMLALIAGPGCSSSPYRAWTGETQNRSNVETASDRVRLNAEISAPGPQVAQVEFANTPRTTANPQNIQRIVHESAMQPPSATVVTSQATPPLPRARVVHRDVEPSGMPISIYGQSIDHAPTSGWASETPVNTRQITFGNAGSIFDPDVDPTAEQIVFSSTRHRQTSDIYIKPIGASTMTQLTTDPAHDVMPTFSPDGRLISFASERSGNWDVYYMDASGGQAVQLTNSPDDELHPTWSPDGRMVAYCKFGSRTGRWEIWVLNIENPGTPTFLTFGIFPTWSPDIAMSKILFQRSPERDSRFHSIWTVDYMGGDARHATMIASAENAALINPAWSPDGSRIVFVTVTGPSNLHEQPSYSDLWTVDLDGQRRTNLTRGRFANYQPKWGRDGHIYFVSDRSGAENIWTISVDSPVNGRMGTNVANAQAATEQP